MATKAKAYPYPVLRNFVDDFDSSSFDFEAQFEINGENLELHYQVKLDDQYLNDRVIDASAALGILLFSNETLQKRWFPLTKFNDSINFDVHEFYGNITFSAFIVSRIDDGKYRPENVNLEFGSGHFEINVGDPLAISDEISQWVSFDRRSNPDLITVQHNTDMDVDSYIFDFSRDTVVISAGSKVMAYFDLLRQDYDLKPHLYQGIYKDALTAAVFELSENSEAQELAWGKNLSAKIQAKNLSVFKGMSFQSCNEIALQLVSADGLRKVLKNDGTI